MEEKAELLKLIQRDIDEICEWGRCDLQEIYKTLVEAKKYIKEEQKRSPKRGN
jgi:hypothetical protein